MKSRLGTPSQKAFHGRHARAAAVTGALIIQPWAIAGGAKDPEPVTDGVGCDRLGHGRERREKEGGEEGEEREGGHVLSPW